MNLKDIFMMVLKVIGLAMGIASVVLSFFPEEIDADTRTTLFGIGRTTLALAFLF